MSKIGTSRTTFLVIASGAATAMLLVAAIPPVAEAQCLAGARNFATVGGGPFDIARMRVDPSGSHGVLGLEFGRFWECSDSDEGNNFVPDDPQKKMAPPGTGGCATREPSQAGGGWWQQSATTLRGVDGFISGTGCFASSCPNADQCLVVEDWGGSGPPGAGDTAFFVGWRSDSTPPGFRYWDHAKFCGTDNCSVPMQEFPVPVVEPGSVADTFTIGSNRDPGGNVYVQTPDAGAASQLIHSYDLLIHIGATDPGRDRNASCGGSCWTLLQQFPYDDSALPLTEIAIPCGLQGTDSTFVAFGLSFVGGEGGPVPSQLVGRAIEILSTCECVDPDVDGWCGDCDDTNAAVYPGAPEICDGLNNDCDHPNWPSLAGTNEADDDGDTFSECAGDCDDTDNGVYPGAPQLCDRLNNDCDDPGWPVPPADDIDADGDSFSGCEGDCDDADVSVNPAAEEVCNAIDDNCNGLTDEDANGEDTDGDGVHNVCDNCPADVNPDQVASDADSLGDACDNCPEDSNEDQADTDADDLGDECDICPTVPNPDQQATVACIVTVSDSGECLEAAIELLDPTTSGVIAIYDSGGLPFSSTPFTDGDLPSPIPITGLADGPASICVESSGDFDCADFVKQGELVVGINGVCDLGPPTALAAAILLSDCGSAAGVDILLDGSGSTDPDGFGDIVLFEWFESFGEPDETFLGTGETLEVTLPLALRFITLRVTDSAGIADTDEILVRYLLSCWLLIDPIEIALERSPFGTRVRWNHVPGSDNYDVIRGQVDDLRALTDRVDLGNSVCIENDSWNEDTESWEDPELPFPGDAFFYVVKQQGDPQGIYGVASAAIPRVPHHGGCP